MEAARTMLIFAKAPLFLWVEAVATACYTLNRSLVHTLHGKTYYELLKGKKPNLQYFRVTRTYCFTVGRSRSALVKGPRTTLVSLIQRTRLTIYFNGFDVDEVVRFIGCRSVNPVNVPAATGYENENGSPSQQLFQKALLAVNERTLTPSIGWNMDDVFEETKRLVAKGYRKEASMNMVSSDGRENAFLNGERMKLSMSKDVTVAESIAERCKTYRLIQVKEDCSVYSVWGILKVVSIDSLDICAISLYYTLMGVIDTF
ncbi:retrovirus-related pol polyprotein from transposon TNT 1-94 [Tanacetum coccineum]|uniref:Retrovirus-related pol polyprotein from transposon TNT 1-94 n=1 Tax=Tanacetum coccineum TaxID=301880 RepID=A0ABQ5GJ81_9ASTR